MNGVILASETHGKPCGKFAAIACCCEPAEMSITVPLIVIGVAVVTPRLGAETVVVLGPMPYAYIWLSYALSTVITPYAIAGTVQTSKASISHKSVPV